MNVLILGTTCVWLNISVWNTWMKWCIRNHTRWCALDCGDSDWSEVALVLRGRAWISPRWWQALPTNPWQWFQIPQCGGLWQPSLIHPNVYTWMKWCIRDHTRDVLWIAATVRLICGCLIGAASLWFLASFFAVTNSWQWSQIPQCGSRISLFLAATHEWSDAS